MKEQTFIEKMCSLYIFGTDDFTHQAVNVCVHVHTCTRVSAIHTCRLHLFVNVLDKDFAVSLNIGIIQTNETALAANRLPLDVFGQTAAPVVIMCSSSHTTIKLYLGIVLIINGLGVDCLIGEPGKTGTILFVTPNRK